MSVTTSRPHATSTPPPALLSDPQSRVDEALHALVTYEGDDVLGLMLHLAIVLNGVALPRGPENPSHSSAEEHIRQRLAERLTAAWPRMEFDGHAQDVADTALQAIHPVVVRLRTESAGWRARTERAIAQRDTARAVALTLEQMNAEAARLLRAGQRGRALAVLESDGRPSDTCATSVSGDGGDDYTGSAVGGVWLPENVFAVVAIHRSPDGEFPALDLRGVYPLVEDANARARDLVLELSPSDPVEAVDPGDGSVSLTVPANGSFAGLIEVVSLEVDPGSGERVVNDGRSVAGHDEAVQEFEQ